MRTLKKIKWETPKASEYKLIANPNADILSIGIDAEGAFEIDVYGIVGSITEEELAQPAVENAVISPLAVFLVGTYKLIENGEIIATGVYESGIEGMDFIALYCKSADNDNPINRIIIRFADSTVA